MKPDVLLPLQGAHTGGRSMVSPGCHLPPSAVAFDGALVIPGSANMKSDAKQYLSGPLAKKESGNAWIVQSYRLKARRPKLVHTGLEQSGKLGMQKEKMVWLNFAMLPRQPGHL